jgi:nucleoid DNA-binding protein
MDKPLSLSMKEYLIRKMSVKMMLSEKTLEAVINHQFNSANEAMKEHNSVEISGFGKFMFNSKKAHKKMEKMLSQEKLFQSRIDDPEFPESKKNSERVKLANIQYNIEVLKPKVYETGFQTNHGRVEEQPDSTVQSETFDRQDS